MSPQYIAAAYKLYSKASEGTDLGITILGNLPLKVKQEDGTLISIPSNEKYPSIDDVMRQNLGVMDELNPERMGSTLWALKWSILVNDAWILGGNHAKTEFHFAYPLLKWADFWNSKAKRMTVVAREALIITKEYWEREALREFFEALPKDIRE